jgi:alkylated DNA repair dioxygenase AlkB
MSCRLSQIGNFTLDLIFDTKQDKNFANEKREVILHSGDALVFGGPSRLIGHNVASIVPNTSPLANLRDARLNLTFREHTRRAKGEKSEKREKSENEGPKYV